MKTGEELAVVSPFAAQSNHAELLRLIVTATLALGIVGAAVYEQLINPNVNSPLIGWAGTIVGVFVGHQVSTQSAQRSAVQTMAAGAMQEHH